MNPPPPPETFQGLIQNTAFLLAMTFIYTLLRPRLDRFQPTTRNLLQGILFGVFAVLLPPIHLPSDVTLSGRSVVFVIAGMFEGWPSAVISAVVYVVIRLASGAPMTISNLGSIITAVVIGVWVYRRFAYQRMPTNREILWVGAVTTLNYMFWTLVSPNRPTQVTFAQTFVFVFAFITAGVFLVATVLVRERKHQQAEKAAHREQDLLRTIIDSTPDLIYIRDLQGRFVIGNRAVDRAFEIRNPNDLIGKKLDDFMRPEFAVQSVAEDQEVIRTKKAILDVEQHVLTRRNQSVWSLTNRLPWKDADGNVIGVISIIRDITERKNMEAQALELTRERDRVQILGDFMRNARHDLNTPITVITSSLFLLGRAQDRESQQRHLQSLTTATTRLQKLLEDMFAMVRLDLATTRFEFQPGDIHVLLKSIWEAQTLRMAEDHAQVEFNLTADRSLVLSDEHELKRAFSELLNNALHFTPADGKITIRSHNQDDGIFIEFEDTGSGICKEDLPRVFERFYRADKARSSANGGTGMGLSIARRIVEIHHGTISVESEVGQGTTFKVFLPVISAHESQPAVMIETP